MLIEAIISGIFIGIIYGLIALGLTIIFGVMGIINMAHGAFVMIGLYISYIITTKFGIDPYLSLLPTVVLSYIFGYLIYKYLIAPIPKKEREMSSLLITLGLGYFLATLALFVFKADYRTVTVSYSSNIADIFGIRISYPALISSIVALAIMTTAYIILNKTYLGRAIIATEQDKEAAQLVGINISKISRITFGMGTLLATVAGNILSPIYYIYPFIGSIFIVKTFTIVVLGGMGSISGAFVGGIILGVVESIAGYFLDYSMKEVINFIIFILILIFRPQGLFGKKVRV